MFPTFFMCHLISGLNQQKSLCFIFSSSGARSTSTAESQLKDSQGSCKSTRVYRDWIKNSKRLSHCLARKLYQHEPQWFYTRKTSYFLKEKNANFNDIYSVKCLLRDAMHSANYAVERCLSVRPSVRLSVTRRYFVEKHRQRFFTVSNDLE